MHTEAFRWVETMSRRHGPFRWVVEYGGRDINGSVRRLFPGSDYTSIDVVPGPGVDVVADATRWLPPRGYDAVVCCEVLEHVERPDLFFVAADWALRPGGRLFFTMATDPRAPHSAADGGPLRPGEFYRNVAPEAVKAWLTDWDDVAVEVHADRGDLYVTARRPET